MSGEQVPTVEQLSSLKLKELKERCKSSGLTVTGSKKDLVDRLHAHLVAQANEESLLLSDEALEADDDASGGGAGVSGEDRSELDEDSRISTPPPASPPPPQPQAVQSLKPEAAKTVTPTPALASQSGAEKETQKFAPSSQSEAPDEADTASSSNSQTEDSTVPKPSTTEDEELDKQPDESSKPEPPQPLQGVLRAPMKASGLAELTEDERRELRAKRFGVAPAAKTTEKSNSASADTTHPEIESRKRARAQRFGDQVAYASPKPAVARGSRQAADASLAPGDVEKMRKRSERFGVVTSPALKRQDGAASAEPADAKAASDETDEVSEEVTAKKRARAARFAGPAVAADGDATEAAEESATKEEAV